MRTAGRVRGSVQGTALACVLACGGAPAEEPTTVDPSSGVGSQSPAGPTGGNGLTVPATCAPSARIQPRLYRLSAGQFGNALRDLLRLQGSPVLVGDTEATLQFYPRDDAPVQASIAEGFSLTSRQVLDNLDVLALSGCRATLAPSVQASCALTFLEGFASRAFRRPLDSIDREGLFQRSDSPFAVGNAAGIANGLRLALEAILNAPSFLYRRELGSANGRLSSLETAEQLGFLLRDSVPDSELWEAALDDRLLTDEQIAAQVDRLLRDRAVQANLTRVVGSWFGAERVLQVSKDPTVFPGFNQRNLQVALFESNRRFLDDVLWNGGGSLSDLLSSPRVFLNADLAQLYGIPFDGDEPSESIPFDLPDQRAGILTQPALMAAFASSLETSIVKRGLFIVRRAMCLPAPPAPPPEIFAQALAQAGDVSQTEKQKAAFRNDPTHVCAGCHALIDPYGIVFENYDAIGGYRTTLPSGEAVDASATMQEQVVLPSDQLDNDADYTEHVSSALEFTQRIAETEQFAFCGGKQLLSYALGHDVDESCVKEDLQRGAIRSDMTIQDVVRYVVLDDLTRRRETAGGN